MTRIHYYTHLGYSTRVALVGPTLSKIFDDVHEMFQYCRAKKIAVVWVKHHGRAAKVEARKAELRKKDTEIGCITFLDVVSCFGQTVKPNQIIPLDGGEATNKYAFLLNQGTPYREAWKRAQTEGLVKAGGVSLK